MDYLIKGICISVLIIFIKYFFNGGTNEYWTNQEGKVIIITGANAGIGFECARELVQLNPATIIMACRDPTRG